jgi:hypothetical protein
MKNEFVPYEQALALKELGFNEPCIGFFYKTILMLGDSMDYPNPNKENFLIAPLYQQAFRWFREKHQLDSLIALVANGYGFYIHKNRNYTNKGESYGMYITYKEAELACLIKLIEMLIE